MAAWVYVVSDRRGHVKVGLSGDVASQLAGLQGANPLPLVLVDRPREQRGGCGPPPRSTQCEQGRHGEDADAVEGVKAFNEKRTAVFTGR